MGEEFLEDDELREQTEESGAEPDGDIFSRNIPVWEIPEQGALIRKIHEEEQPAEEKPHEKKLSAEEEFPAEMESAEDGPMLSEVENLRTQLAAAKADLYNYRQRVERDRSKVRKLLVEDKIVEFLPVLDNLDRALSVSEEGTARDVLVGVRMVQRQFLSILENSGVTIIPAEGCPFDPLTHDAIETEFVDAPEEDGAVLCELLRGYRTPERVLRPAQVRVGRLRVGDGGE